MPNDQRQLKKVSERKMREMEEVYWRPTDQLDEEIREDLTARALIPYPKDPEPTTRPEAYELPRRPIPAQVLISWGIQPPAPPQEPLPPDRPQHPRQYPTRWSYGAEGLKAVPPAALGDRIRRRKGWLPFSEEQRAQKKLAATVDSETLPWLTTTERNFIAACYSDTDPLERSHILAQARARRKATMSALATMIRLAKKT